MSLDSKSDFFYYILILFAAGILCFINLGGTPVYILDEAKNAEAAREMLLGNNWLVPVFNGELRVDKPPLHYWFMILAYKLFGVSEFSSRFFSAVFGVLTIVSTFHFTRKYIDRKAGLITAFILCSAIMFVNEFHLAVPDPYLIFFLSFGLFSFYDFWKTGKHSSGLAFYVSIGLAVLSKGPVAILLPGLIILLFLIFRKELNLKKLVQLRAFSGAVIVLLICLPWFLKVHQLTNGEFTRGFFLEHNIGRFSSEMEGHGGWFFVTWAFVLLGLLPFSFFIIQGFVQSWKRRTTNDFLFFSFLTASVFIGFFSVSFTKLPNYPMPGFPFIAVIIGYYLKILLDEAHSLKAYKISLWSLFVITLLMPFGAYIVFLYVEPELYSENLSTIQLSILPAGSLLALYYLKKKKIFESLLSIGFAFIFLSLQLHQFIFPSLVSKSPSVMATEFMNHETPVMIYKGYDPALLFNIQRTFEQTDSKELIYQFSKENPGALIVTKSKFFDQEWKDDKTEVLLRQKAVFENYTLVIFKLD